MEQVVQVTFTKRPPAAVEIDIDKLAWADYKRIQEIQRNLADDEEGMMEQLIDVINLISSVDLRTLPIRALNAVIQSVVSEFGAEADPKN